MSIGWKACFPGGPEEDLRCDCGAGAIDITVLPGALRCEACGYIEPWPEDETSEILAAEACECGGYDPACGGGGEVRNLKVNS
jgi:hypothetical protein